MSLYWIIIAIVLADFALSIVLSLLNRKASRQSIPTRLAGLYDTEAYTRQQDYFRQNSNLSLLQNVVSTGLLLVFFAFGVYAIFDTWAGGMVSYPLLVSLCFFGIVYLCAWVVDLPAGIYDTFVIETRFGFNKTTPAVFALDQIKSLGLNLVISGGFLAAIIWIYNIIPDCFWIAAWGVMTLISVVMQFLYSDIIVPIFNRQTPLEAGELRDAIEHFAHSVGFKIKDIYVINGSKRSTHANAYFTGFGPRKRIVLYDTLIEQLGVEEIVGVLAHEIGHYKHRHILKSMFVSMITNAVVFYLFSLVISSDYVAQAAGCQHASFHINMVVFMLLFTPIDVVLGVVGNVLSRKHEWQADEFARAHGMGPAISSALKNMSKKNLSNLTPHPAVVWMRYSHPTLLQRVEHLDE